MGTWQAAFYENRHDPTPSRIEIIKAETENEAASKAAARMGTAMRVDVVRTILKPQS
jgi:hypothetical protein